MPGLTSCSGGAADHQFLVNPRAALGEEGTAWFGSSWVGTDGGTLNDGVEVAAAGEGIARPARSAQDIAVLPDHEGTGARALWNTSDQIPDPATNLSAGQRISTARVGTEGGFGATVTALDPGPGGLLDDPALVRADDATLVVTASAATPADLVVASNPLTVDQPVRFRGVSARTTDDGLTWTPGAAAGTPVLATYRRDGATLLLAAHDVRRDLRRAVPAQGRAQRHGGA